MSYEIFSKMIINTGFSQHTDSLILDQCLAPLEYSTSGRIWMEAQQKIDFVYDQDVPKNPVAPIHSVEVELVPGTKIVDYARLAIRMSHMLKGAPIISLYKNEPLRVTMLDRVEDVLARAQDIYDRAQKAAEGQPVQARDPTRKTTHAAFKMG